jgi:pyruvate/2-oxoglutarate dehydrogenase complex dihydrolipoamide acyltransferase (E2) component
MQTHDLGDEPGEAFAIIIGRSVVLRTFVALMLGGLLALAGCHTPRAQDTPQKSAAAPVTSAVAAPVTQPTPAPSNPASSPKPAPKTSIAPIAPAAKPASAAAAPGAASPAAAKLASPASLDLNSLEQRLKDTQAIGVFTKLSLKNQVDDLLGDLREYHKGSSPLAQTELRQKYDLLITKVLSLLQSKDPPLASAIASSREAIWQILMDPNKFAKI